MNKGVVAAAIIGIGAVLVYLIFGRQQALTTPVTTGGIPNGATLSTPAYRPVGVPYNQPSPVQQPLTGLAALIGEAEEPSGTYVPPPAATPSFSSAQLAEVSGPALPVGPSLQATGVGLPGVSLDTSNIPMVQASGVALPSPAGSYFSDASVSDLPGISSDDFTDSLNIGV